MCESPGLLSRVSLSLLQGCRCPFVWALRFVNPVLHLKQHIVGCELVSLAEEGRHITIKLHSFTLLASASKCPFSWRWWPLPQQAATRTVSWWTIHGFGGSRHSSLRPQSTRCMAMACRPALGQALATGVFGVWTLAHVACSCASTTDSSQQEVSHRGAGSLIRYTSLVEPRALLPFRPLHLPCTVGLVAGGARADHGKAQLSTTTRQVPRHWRSRGDDGAHHSCRSEMGTGGRRQALRRDTSPVSRGSVHARRRKRGFACDSARVRLSCDAWRAYADGPRVQQAGLRRGVRHGRGRPVVRRHAYFFIYFLICINFEEISNTQFCPSAASSLQQSYVNRSATGYSTGNNHECSASSATRGSRSPVQRKKRYVRDCYQLDSRVADWLT